MSAFTIIGLLMFWASCFRLGYLLAWAADDHDGIVIGMARVIVGIDRLEKNMREVSVIWTRP